MFRTGFLSIVKSLVLYTLQQVYVIQFHHPASKQSAKPVWHIPVAVYTVLDSWWWTENLSETCKVLSQK